MEVGHEHDKVTEFHVCPVAHVIHENPFQFLDEQAHVFDTASHWRPPKQLMQATPFQLDPVGHPQDLVAAFQFWAVGQAMQVTPFQLSLLGHPHVKVAGYHTWLALHVMHVIPFQLPVGQMHDNREVLQTWES